MSKTSGPMTATQQRIYNMLLDGQGHTVDELFTCLDDELAQRSTVATHICYMRRKLPPGLVIVMITQGSMKPRMYRLLREITSTVDG